MTPPQKLYALLDAENGSRASRHVRSLEVALILLGIASVSAGTMDDLSEGRRLVAGALTAVVAALFLVEYAVRLWTAPHSPHRPAGTAPWRARWRWATSAEGLIDLVAILPMLVTLSGGAKLGADSAAAFVFLWVLKLATHAPGVGLIARVLRNEQQALAAVAVLFVIVLLGGATAAYFVEQAAQPRDFASIPASLWWAIVTLTTTGYGDVVPQSAPGRMVGGVLMISGIAVLALLAGLLANGFAQEIKRRQLGRHERLRAVTESTPDGPAVARRGSRVGPHRRTVSAAAYLPIVRMGAARPPRRCAPRPRPRR